MLSEDIEADFILMIKFPNNKMQTFRTDAYGDDALKHLLSSYGNSMTEKFKNKFDETVIIFILRSNFSFD